MKSCLLALLVGAMLYSGAVGDQSNEGRSLLRNSKPLEHVHAILISHDDPSAVALAGEQLRAINILASSMREGDVTTLIPYLDYTGDPLTTDAGHPPTMDEDIGRLKELYPAFGAIVNNPGFKTELKDYTMNSANPIRLRLTAWIVLRYVDKRSFESVSKIMVDLKGDNDLPK